MAQTKTILISAGEPSGDLHASNLVKDLNALESDLRFFGLGGSLCKNAGVEILLDITKLALIGLVEVLRNIFAIKDAWRSVISKIDSQKPDLAILVDYPGFNLRLAGELKKRSIPVVYYISPQVWIWGRGRVNIIKRCVKKMFVFFKFEEELYRTYGIDAEFVGHPLLDIVKTSLSKQDVLEKYNLSFGSTTVALLPGSRRTEIKTLLPLMLGAARAIKEKLGDIQFIIAKHPDLPLVLYEDPIKKASVDVVIAEGDTYNVVGASDFSIVASGTATLETAIIGTPHIIIYKTNLITYLVAKSIADVRFLGIVNVMNQRMVVPELIQHDASPEHIAASALEILGDSEKMASVREELKSVTSSLGSPGASKRAAAAILPLLQ